MIEKFDTYLGHRYMVKALPGLGWRCGYVEMELPVCHGGITYAETYWPNYKQANGLVLGFDCGHFFDRTDPALDPQVNIGEGHLWTTEDVERECKHMIRQIIAKDSEESIVKDGECSICNGPVKKEFDFCPYCGVRLVHED